MKWLLMLLSLLSLSSQAFDRVPMTTGKIYVPHGFDTNDVVEVTVIGRLPDLCHRNPTFEVERVGNTFKISLYAYYVPSSTGCRNISMPYKETISLGMLPVGTFNIELKGFGVPSDKARVQVSEAISSLQDDFKYGNVMGISEDEAGRGIELRGTNQVSCLKFEWLEAIIQAEVIVLKPHFKEVGECLEQPTPFTIRYEVPYLQNHPRGVLLHVRVMDGRSYNYLYRNKL